MNESAPKPPPDFDLAPLFGVDPASLLRDKDDEMGAFVLALAVAFNDLKGAYYLHEQLDYFQKDRALRPLNHAGQLSGMSDQVVRLLMGLVHEVLELIREHESILECDEWKRLLQELGPEDLASWSAVVVAALKEDRAPQKHDATSGLLTKLRNGVAFHYGTKVITKGYLTHFARNSGIQHSERAVISDGKNMEGTRFYFADAAMVQATAALTHVDRSQVHRQVSDLARNLANALRALVLSFVFVRDPDPTPYPDGDSTTGPSVRPSTPRAGLQRPARTRHGTRRRKR